MPGTSVEDQASEETKENKTIAVSLDNKIEVLESDKDVELLEEDEPDVEDTETEEEEYSANSFGPPNVANGSSASASSIPEGGWQYY